MSVQERIRAVRLLEQIEKKPKYSQVLGVSVKMTRVGDQTVQNNKIRSS